jgi:hypothetical protein
MTARRLIVALLLLTSGFAAGLVITGRTRVAGEVAAQNAPAAPAVVAPGPVAAGAALPDFSAVAARTVPAVVNIS